MTVVKGMSVLSRDDGNRVSFSLKVTLDLKIKLLIAGANAQLVVNLWDIYFHWSFRYGDVESVPP